MNYRKLTTRLLVFWFFLVWGGSALHLFQTDPEQLPLPLGLAVLVPCLTFGMWFFCSSRFRTFVFGLDRSVLTMIQSWRVAGFIFLVLHTYRILPGFFALPAGWGDILVGVTAPWAASKLSDGKHRISFILWQIVGMADLLLAVGLGATAYLLEPNGIPTSVMTVLPMSLIPTFAVPLLLILHSICIVQTVRGSGSGRLLFGENLPATAS